MKSLGFILLAICLLFFIGYKVHRRKKLGNTREIEEEHFTIENYTSIPSDIRSYIEQNETTKLSEILNQLKADRQMRNYHVLKNAILFKNPKLMEIIEQEKLMEKEL